MIGFASLQIKPWFYLPSRWWVPYTDTFTKTEITRMQDAAMKYKAQITE